MSDPLPLPMIGYYRRVTSEYGEHEFSAEMLQPAGCELQVDFSIDLVNWSPVGSWSPYFEDQQVFVTIVTNQAIGYIRAQPLVPSIGSSLTPTTHLSGVWSRSAAPLGGCVEAGVTWTMSQVRPPMPKV